MEAKGKTLSGAEKKQTLTDASIHIPLSRTGTCSEETCLYALCCVFNSPVKSINSYPSDWLELINMPVQDVNGRGGRSELLCQTPALQGQNHSKFMLCRAGWQSSSYCELPGHSTVSPWHLSPEQVLGQALAAFFSRSARLCFSIEYF